MSAPALRLEQLACEVNSKCGTLRAASRLLPGLSDRDSEELLGLMAAEALRLAQSLDDHRQEAALAFSPRAATLSSCDP